MTWPVNSLSFSVFTSVKVSLLVAIRSSVQDVLVPVPTGLPMQRPGVSIAEIGSRQENVCPFDGSTPFRHELRTLKVFQQGAISWPQQRGTILA